MKLSDDMKLGAQLFGAFIFCLLVMSNLFLNARLNELMKVMDIQQKTIKLLTESVSSMQRRLPPPSLGPDWRDRFTNGPAL